MKNDAVNIPIYPFQLISQLVLGPLIFGTGPRLRFLLIGSSSILTIGSGLIYGSYFFSKHPKNPLILVPKKEAPDELKDFRPISLYNVIYKIVA